MISRDKYGVTLRGFLGHINAFEWDSMWGYRHK